MSWVRWLESKKVISAAPDGDALVGLFSERDLLKRVVAECRDPAVTAIAEVCSTESASSGWALTHGLPLQVFRVASALAFGLLGVGLLRG